MGPEITGHVVGHCSEWTGRAMTADSSSTGTTPGEPGRHSCWTSQEAAIYMIAETRTISINRPAQRMIS